jgi:hypothetical protein
MPFEKTTQPALCIVRDDEPLAKRVQDSPKTNRRTESFPDGQIHEILLEGRMCDPSTGRQNGLNGAAAVVRNGNGV